MLTADELDIRFTYHQPKEGQPKVYESIRKIAKDFAAYIIIAVPDSREQSLALTKLEEAVFWANAAIARRS